MRNATENCTGRRRALLIALLPACAAASFAALSPAFASDRHLSLEFEAYVGGLSALTVGVEAGLGPEFYAVDFRFGTRGAVSWIVAWTMNAHSRGTMRDGMLVPASAGAHSLWNGRKRTTILAYGEDGSVAARLVPEPSSRDREKVPDALKRGTVDLSSAILATLDAVGRDGTCARRANVYDGRRRYDLVLEDAGKGALESSSASVYRGPTLICRLWVDPVAGFQRTASRTDWATGDMAVIHIARVFDGGPPVPVALEYETGLGLMRAYLVDATFSDGTRQQRLATNPAVPAKGAKGARPSAAP